MKGNNYNFWKLISEYSIEIPIIQRDYAQGRDNSKSEDIRSTFIGQIKDSLDKKEPLHLNFIYGKVTDSVFIPLDGQQRLTTLFLLYRYFMPDSDEKNILKKFSYKIRSSSEDFSNALVDNIINTSEDQLLNSIVDSPWFRTSWKKDPTVSGMLRMLDEIHYQFKDVETENYWKLLTDNNIINFEFLDLEKYNLTDELYLKMNSRGKPLTDFESFKAWLIEYVEENKYSMIENWTILLDTNWTDLFWRYKDDTNMQVDEEYLRYFRNMAQIYFVQNDLSFETGKDNDKVARKVATIKGEDAEYIYVPNSFYKDLGCYSSDSLNEIFSIFNIFYENDEKIIEALEGIIFFIEKESLFEAFISGVMSYKDKVRFYAMSLYLLQDTKLDNKKAFMQWMRVVRNLIENTNIDSIDTFSRAIRGIKELSRNCLDIYAYLNDKILGINEQQRKEEYLKAQLIINDTRWESVLLNIENHPLFQGNIRFLLENSEDADFARFKHLSNNAKNYFDKDGVNSKLKKNSILLRAMISQFTEENQLLDIVYDNDRITWKKILKNTKYFNPLIKVFELESDEKFPQLIEEDSIIEDDIAKRVHLDLYKTNFLSSVEVGSFFRKWWGNTFVLFPYRTSSQKKRYFIGKGRNKILSNLIEEGKISLNINDQQLKVNDGVIPFFWGTDIPFKYNEEEFVWFVDDRIKHEDIVMKLDWNMDFLEFLKISFDSNIDK